MDKVSSYFVDVICFIVSAQGVPIHLEVTLKAILVKLVLNEVFAVVEHDDVLLKHPLFNLLLALARHRAPRRVTKLEHYH